MASSDTIEKIAASDISGNGATSASHISQDDLQLATCSDKDSQAQRESWRKTLADPAQFSLPTDRPRTTKQSFARSQVPIHFGASLTHSLKNLSREHDVELDTTLMAGWITVLSRLSRQDDIIINVSITCRDQLVSSEFSERDSFPLRILSGELDTVQLLKSVKSTILSATDLLGFLENSTIKPMSQVMFQWRKPELSSDTQGLIQAPTSPVLPKVDLELNLQELGDEIIGEMRYSMSLFDPDTIKRHTAYLLTVLDSMVENAMRPLAAIDILPHAERKLLLEIWNEPSTAYPDHFCSHQLFEHQAKMTPNATAVVWEGQVLSYGDLNEHANRLAHRLIGMGVHLDTHVAICVASSPAMIIGILAIMKAGGAYVPLDPAYASERLRDILHDASPLALLADETGRTALGEGVISLLNVIDPNEQLVHPTSNPQIPGLTPHHLAYIIYTSGSRGKSKGVMIEHRGVVNLVQTNAEFCHIHTDSRVLQFASPCFDPSVWEVMLPLSCGASLYIPPDRVRQDRNKVWEYMAEHSITHMSLSPSFLQDGKDLPALTVPLTVVLRSESLNPALTRSLIAQGYTLINDFGTTETTVSATAWRCPSDFNSDTVPIGRPVIHSRIYLLDEYQQPVPLGAAGEMYIGGIGVARGYLNMPDLTKERFLLDPFSRIEGARMYKTGDQARYLPDGNVVFLARNDDQVRFRGFRVELEEIESLLVRHPCVSAATVIVQGANDNQQLFAYVVANPKEHLTQELRSFLGTKLPEYMIPIAFVRLDGLPLNANDKLDRKSLPAPGEDAFARDTYEAPQGAIERTLATIWAKLLGISRIGRLDNFFALGGHSFLVMRMLNHLHRIGLTVPIRTVYEAPVLNELSQAVIKHRTESVPANPITPHTNRLTPEMLPLIHLTQVDIDHIVKQTPGGLANIQDIYALLPLQDGILFHHLLASNGDPYLLSAQMAFESRELLDRYFRAFQCVVERHDILRTAFIWKDVSTPAQIVWRQATLDIQEVSLNPSDGPIMNQLSKRFSPDHFRIDLTRAPLFRFFVSQDSDGRWLLVQLVHRLISDHAAAEEMSHEIETILNGREDTLSAPQPFRNLVAQARLGLDHDSHEQFFNEMLADIDEPTFPFGLAKIYYDNADISESRQILPRDLNDQLRFQAKQFGVSLATLIHVAWAQVLARTSGQERVVFGTVLVGGMQAAENNHTVGCSINTLPFRCDMDSRSVRDCVHQTHIRLAALMEHEHASLSLAQRCSGVPAGTPLFSGLLDFLHTSLPSETGSEVFETGSVNQEEEVHFPGIEFIAGRKRTNYPIALNVDDFGAAIYLTIQVINPIDPARVSEYMKQSLKSLVEALENNPDMAAIRLEVLPPEEHDLLLHTWNSDTMEYPKHQTIHGLFEETVMRMPEAIAIVHDDHELTYEDLNACANRLAHQLIELGVQLDTLVAICVDRSPAMLIGVLAVLKAGGVYVPMDPSYASKRLNNIIADAKPAILIADTVGRTILRDLDLPSITVVDPNASLALPSVNPKIVDLTSRHLAYIISTSGSAYKPKGVMIEHEGVVNLVVTRPAVCDIGSSSRVLLFPSFSFDSSVVEIFSTLCLGGALYLITDRIRLDRHQLWDYLKIHSITHALLPPAILQDCHDLSPLGSPLTLIIAGDALPPSLLRTLQGLIPNGRIINDYGPTEATVSSITWMCPQDFNDDVVPIGRPIRNKRVYILNRHHQPVPPGAVGDLYIGGVGVGRGYRNKPKLTEEVFLSDPFVRDRDPEARMYKTGDLARYLPDGNIVYMGRDDHQVKIRGFRIELGEIESRLTEHPLVQMTAVIALGEGIDKRLIAYVAAIPDDQLVPSLRSHLASCLPDYMVPAAFMRLDTLPLNSSGKIDRKALPEPDNDAIGHQDFEARGEIESALRDIWVELFNVDRIGRHDCFFILGGHSLLAVKLISQIRSLMGFNITLRMLFEAPTIAELSARLLDTSNSQEDAFDVLLPIRPQGSRSPLFCIHPGMGLSWCFIGLSRHLNADQPLYGLQERGFFDNGQPAATIDEMASDYIYQIRRIQAHGPYHLLGYSFGGMVAHTMAAQLEQQGEKVSLLALMGSIPSLKDTREFNVAQDILPHVGGGDVDEILTKTFWKKASDVCQWNDRLGRLHIPLIYNGEMLLFQVMVPQESEDQPLDPEVWIPYVQGKIHVYDINCKHDDLFEPEVLTEIGSVLAQKLGEASVCKDNEA